MNPFDHLDAHDPQAAAWQACAAAWTEHLRGLTATAYAGDIRQFVAFAGCPPWSVNATHARAWSSTLRDTHAAASINRKMAAGRSLYDYASRWQPPLWTAANPFDGPGLRSRVAVFGRSRFPSESEIRKLLAAIPLDDARGWRDFALFFGLVCTARRIGEWLHVRWSDIAEGPDGSMYFSYRAKGGKTRRQAIPDVLWQVVNRYLDEARRCPLGEEYVFTPLGGDGSAGLTTQHAGRLLRAYGEQAGVERESLHLHGLRHAGARWRKQHGATVFELQDVLGHSLLTTTQIYTDAVLSIPTDRLAGAVAELLPPAARRRLHNPRIMQPG